jgi:hypothetical protein
MQSGTSHPLQPGAAGTARRVRGSQKNRRHRWREQAVDVVVDCGLGVTPGGGRVVGTGDDQGQLRCRLHDEALVGEHWAQVDAGASGSSA